MSKKVKYIYICGVDWQHELGEVTDFTPAYSTIKDLKRQRDCWKNCGIVRLKVSLDKWVTPQKKF